VNCWFFHIGDGHHSTPGSDATRLGVSSLSHKANTLASAITVAIWSRLIPTIARIDTTTRTNFIRIAIWVTFAETWRPRGREAGTTASVFSKSRPKPVCLLLLGEKGPHIDRGYITSALPQRPLVKADTKATTVTVAVETFGIPAVATVDAAARANTIRVSFGIAFTKIWGTWCWEFGTAAPIGTPARKTCRHLPGTAAKQRHDARTRPLRRTC
jgi:hypothetical protein